MVSRRERNRRIGEFLKELEMTEGRSTGIPKIPKEMAANSSPAPLFETDAKRNSMNFHPLAMRIASNTGRPFGNLLNCGLCDLVPLYPVYFNLDGVRK